MFRLIIIHLLSLSQGADILGINRQMFDGFKGIIAGCIIIIN